MARLRNTSIVDSENTLRFSGFSSFPHFSQYLQKMVRRQKENIYGEKRGHLRVQGSNVEAMCDIFVLDLENKLSGYIFEIVESDGIALIVTL